MCLKLSCCVALLFTNVYIFTRSYDFITFDVRPNPRILAPEESRVNGAIINRWWL
jgi:hypothetical protein